MRFSKALHILLYFFLEADPKPSPYLLRKVDLTDAYMRICVRLHDIPSMYFLIQKENKEEEQLVILHLYILMRYVEPAHLFCAATETVNYMVNNTMASRKGGPKHLLGKLE